MPISKSDYAKQITPIKHTLYRIAYSYMNNQSLALDALDEAIYKGYVNRNKLNNPDLFKTWLTRILINECLQMLRKNKHVILTDEFPQESQQMYDSLPLKEAIRTLPGDLSKLIYLRYYGGYTLAETAAILEIPLGTVATRERRALALLRLEMDE